MNDKELDRIVRSKLDGYLEATSEAFPSVKEMFSYCPTLKDLLRIIAVNGARWYLQSLWHDASEMPDASIIPLYKDNSVKDAVGAPLRSCVILTDDLQHITIFSDHLYSEEDWQTHYVEHYGIHKWLYVSDIMPKGGER